MCNWSAHMTNYSVGQVLFLVSKKDQKVVPIQVVEEVRRKNLSGESIDYLVTTPYSGEKKINLKKVDAETYEDLDSLRVALLKKAQDLLDGICFSAGKIATETFGWNEKTRVSEIHELAKERDPISMSPDESSGAVVSLEDGTKVHLPPEISGVVNNELGS